MAAAQPTEAAGNGTPPASPTGGQDEDASDDDASSDGFTQRVAAEPKRGARVIKPLPKETLRKRLSRLKTPKLNGDSKVSNKLLEQLKDMDLVTAGQLFVKCGNSTDRGLQTSNMFSLMCVCVCAVRVSVNTLQHLVWDGSSA